MDLFPHTETAYSGTLNAETVKTQTFSPSRIAAVTRQQVTGLLKLPQDKGVLTEGNEVQGIII